MSTYRNPNDTLIEALSQKVFQAEMHLANLEHHVNMLQTKYDFNWTHINGIKVAIEGLKDILIESKDSKQDTATPTDDSGIYHPKFKVGDRVNPSSKRSVLPYKDGGWLVTEYVPGHQFDPEGNVFVEGKTTGVSDQWLRLVQVDAKDRIVAHVITDATEGYVCEHGVNHTGDTYCRKCLKEAMNADDTDSDE